MIGWRKMPIRSQETMMRWVFDETVASRPWSDGPAAYRPQSSPSRSPAVPDSIAKGNPEGKSPAAYAYRSWYFKKRLEEFEAIGVERDLAGMPVAQGACGLPERSPGTEQAKTSMPSARWSVVCVGMRTRV
jgi:hypothetical protein